MMNAATGDCLLYSAGVYGFDDAPAAVSCRGRDLMDYRGQGGAVYPPSEAATDLYDSRGLPSDYRHVVAASPFFGRISAAADLLAFPATTGSYSGGGGDCYAGFPTSYGAGQVRARTTGVMLLFPRSERLVS